MSILFLNRDKVEDTAWTKAQTDKCKTCDGSDGCIWNKEKYSGTNCESLWWPGLRSLNVFFLVNGRTMNVLKGGSM